MAKNETGIHSEVAKNSSVETLRGALADALGILRGARAQGQEIIAMAENASMKKVTIRRIDTYEVLVPSYCYSLTEILEWFEKAERWPTERQLADTDWEQA